MKTSTLLISIGVLTGTVLIGYFFGTKQKQERKVNKYVVTNSIIREVAHIDINNMTFVLKKGDKKEKDWEYKRDKKVLPVSRAKVNELLKNISKLGRGRLIASNPDNLNSYGLSKKEDNIDRTVLVLKNNKGKNIFSLFLGKENVPSQFYAQFNDDKEVYLVEWKYRISTNDDYWLDKALFVDKLSSNTITKITIHSKKLKRAIEIDKQKNNKWKLASSDKKTVNKDAVEQYISFVSKLKANNFADIEANDSLLYGTVHLIGNKDEDNREIKIYYFANAYYAKASGKRKIYMFSLEKYIIDTLFPSESHFIEEKKEKEEEKKEKKK